MPRRRLGLVAVLAIALLLASPIGATDTDDDLTPPSNARARRDGRAASDRGPSASGGGAESDPASALATARGGDRRVVQEVSFVLEHSLTVEPGEAANFEPAGVFHAKAHFTAGAGAATAEPGADADADDAHHRVAPGSAVRLSHLRLERNVLDEDFEKKFATLVERDLPYRVSLPANALHPVQNERVVAFIPARCLAESGLQEHFVAHMDERGNVIGIDYDPAGFECAPSDEVSVVELGKSPSFKSTASVRFYKTAPALDPDAPTDVRGHGGPAGKKEREARQRRSSGGDGGDRKDGAETGKEKTFWQKNWMYIVPVMMLLSNLVAPPPEQSRPKRS